MKRIKDVLGCVWVTILLWTLSRIIPSMVRVLYPEGFFVALIVSLTMLPTGWWITCKVTKKKHPWCIRANLSIYALLEATGVLETISMLMRELSFYTGRYHYDSYGIAYSDYLLIYGGLLLFEITYIVLCLYLGKKTTSLPEVENIPPEPQIVDRRLEEIRRLEDEISKMKASLKEHDDAYAINKKILSETYTDDELRTMVDKRELSPDRAKEYASERDGLAILVNTAPQIRETTVKMIGDLSKQLAELECE